MEDPGEQLPRLREDLTVRPPVDGNSERPLLIDSTLSQRIQLSPVLEAALDAWPDATTLQELAEVMGCDTSAARRVSDFFLSRHLVDTPGSREFIASAMQTKKWATTPGDEASLLIRDDAAFSCTMCGGCCTGQNIGPVEPQTVEALKPHETMLQEVTGSKKGFFYSMPIRGADGETKDTLICQMRDDACVFLGEDRLCTLHGKLGAESKPGVCQIFPYRFIATPEGVAVTIRMECRGFVDARRGTALRDKEAEIRKLLSLAPIRSVRPLIQLSPTEPLSYARYITLENKLHTAVDECRDTPMDALIRLRDEVGRESAVPLAPLDSPDALLQSLHELVGRALQSVNQLKAEYGKDSAEAVVEVGALDSLGNAWVSLFSDLDRVVQGYAEPAARSLFADHAHHFLMAKDLTAAQSIVTGMARMALSWFLTKALVVHRTRLVKRRHILPQDVMDSLTLVNHFFRNHDVQRSMRPLDKNIVKLFYHSLSELVSAAPNLVPRDTAPEMYKF